MIGEPILSLLAILFALIAGMSAGTTFFQAAQRRMTASAMLASTRREGILLRLQGGFTPFRGISERLMGAFPFLDDSFESATMLLGEHAMQFTKVSLCSLLLAASMASALVGLAISWSPAFGMAVGCLVFAGTLAYVRNVGEKRNASMREQVPEALRNLSMSFRSGHSLPQTLANSAQEMEGYISYLFSVAADRLEMGATPTEALSVMRGNARVPELSFVAVALDVQHQSGGSIAPVLESAMESVEGELKLARSLKVQTAQARLSASIVTVMPFILVALFSLMSPGFLSPFFSSFVGMVMLAIALAMQVAGILIVRRMLKVDAG